MTTFPLFPLFILQDISPQPVRSGARWPVTFECGSPLLHVATLADASQEASSAGLETWIRERNNCWLTIAVALLVEEAAAKICPSMSSKHRARTVQAMHLWQALCRVQALCRRRWRKRVCEWPTLLVDAEFKFWMGLMATSESSHIRCRLACPRLSMVKRAVWRCAFLVYAHAPCPQFSAPFHKLQIHPLPTARRCQLVLFLCDEERHILLWLYNGSALN